ncbi:MAG TPA: glycosyltransferase [Pedobacter sp.]|nr:glycosyltransferase [Pedobacter sp.]
MKLTKRVILMTPSMSKGGAETQLLKIGLFLKARGYAVLLISLKPIDEFNGEIGRSGINTVFLKKWNTHFFSNIRLMTNAINAFKPDVIVAFMFVAIIFARLVKLFIKFRLISTIRISVLPKKWYLLFKITSGLDDAIVYNSIASRTNFESRHLSLKGGIVINNGVRIPITLSKRSDNNPDVFTWVCIAHFRWNKDYMTLFKAISLIKDRKFIIDIIGELNNEVWPYEAIRDMGIGNHVRLLGFKPNTAGYLARSDAFVLSSFSEGMPNAILEAMAHSKPIVVTDIDGNHELVQKAGCGFLCEKQNEMAMATNMLKVMDMTAEERMRLGTKGKHYVEVNFGENNVMNEWKGLIDELVR